jgi:hypothetical protein
VRKIQQTKRDLIRDHYTMASAVNDQARHLEQQVKTMEKDEDRRLMAEKAQRQLVEQERFRNRYDKFEQNRDQVMSQHYQKVIVPDIERKMAE